MAANPIIRLGGKRAHTETTVLGQLKKKSAEPRSCLGELPHHSEVSGELQKGAENRMDGYDKRFNDFCESISAFFSFTVRIGIEGNKIQTSPQSSMGFPLMY